MMQEMEEVEAVNPLNGKLIRAYQSYRKWCDDRRITWVSRADMRQAICLPRDLNQGELDNQPDYEPQPDVFNINNFFKYIYIKSKYKICKIYLYYEEDYVKRFYIVISILNYKD